MTSDILRSKISDNIGKSVVITVYGMRGKIDRFEGIINKTYSNIFTIKTSCGEKSFPYRDILTKEINIKYL